MLFVKTLTQIMVMLALLSLSLRLEVLPTPKSLRHTPLPISVSLLQQSPTEVLKHVSKHCLFSTYLLLRSSLAVLSATLADLH